MKKIIIICTASFFIAPVFAQDSLRNGYKEWKPSRNEYAHVDIGKYFTPDIVRNQLDVLFDVRSNYLRSEYAYLSTDLTTTNPLFAGSVASSFSHEVNTRKKISSFVGSFSFNGEHTSQKDEQTIPNYPSAVFDHTSTSTYLHSLQLGWSNQWYFSKLFYMDYRIISNLSYDYNNTKSKNQSEESSQNQKNLSLRLSPVLGIGYGRIENVRDARHAVYLAQALSKKRVLTRNLSDDELMELSQIISTVKNKRFLDARLHTIDEVTAVDSFFEENDLLTDHGAAYFTTLYDMWQYGDLFSRYSGYRISFLAQPFYDYYHFKSHPVIRDFVYHSNQYMVGLHFAYEKPFKLRWQHSVAAEVSGGLNASKQTENSEKSSDKRHTFLAFASYSLGYYPNTRTHIQVTTSQQLLKYMYDDERDSMRYISELSAQLYYYFSPNLRLTGDYALYYSPYRTKGSEGNFMNTTNFSSSFRLKFAYSFF